MYVLVIEDIKKKRIILTRKTFIIAVKFLTKEEIRKQIRKDLRNQKEEDRLRKSLVIQERLFALPEFNDSKTILFYVSFDGEVETSGMIRQAKELGKRIALPNILKKDRKIIPILVESFNDLEVGPYGIRQPAFDPNFRLDPGDLDLCVVPGMAFDRTLHRLGRGAGYYDRFLTTLSEKTRTVGLAFHFQVLDCLPTEEHDVPLSHLISD